MITEYENLCALCNKKAEHIHHLICGTANRRKSEEYGLTIPLCADCHNKVHSSKHTLLKTALQIVGQVYFEGRYEDKEKARELFRKEFGKSWI